MTTSDETPTPVEERPDEPRSWAAGHVIVAVVVALVVGMLLNAQDLLATAERQPFGWQRDVAVALAEPVADLSAAIGLDTPRDAIDRALDREEDLVVDDGPSDEDAPILAEGPIASESPTDVPPTDDASTSGSPSATASAEPETLNGVERGSVTADDPLELVIAGDSMVEIQFGTALEDLANDTGLIETLTIDFDRGSGLTRPDYIDWPARLRGLSEEHDPDAFVVYFGGNDAQPLEIDGAVYEPGAPEWQDEYRSRVATVMDDLTEAGHHVYWMALPIPSSDTMVERFSMMNAIYRSEAEGRDMVTYVDVYGLFAGDDGRYREYLPNQNGDVVDMRLDDGIHLTTAGAYRAARPTIAAIVEGFAIDVPVEADPVDDTA